MMTKKVRRSLNNMPMSFHRLCVAGFAGMAADSDNGVKWAAKIEQCIRFFAKQTLS
jgi:hypothetical protein